jgi:cobalt-zinc-cadmium efflux system protein
VSRSTRLAVALAINLCLVVAQAVGAAVAHSTGLLADAGHNLTDAAAIVLSLVAVRWALRPRSDVRSFGHHRATILAALANAVLLVVVTLGIVVVSVIRLVHPVKVDGSVMVLVAGIAVIANAAAALVLVDHRDDLNMRATLWHLVSDAAASLCVLAAGVAIALSGSRSWDRLDPVASLVVSVLIVIQAVRLVRDSTDVLLESTPPDVDLAELRAAITAVDGVGEVHDLHVWSLSSDVRALSAHLVLTGHPTLEEAQAVTADVRLRVAGPFSIAHTTLESECERCTDVPGDPCEVDELNASGVPGPGRERTPSNRSA